MSSPAGESTMRGMIMEKKLSIRTQLTAIYETLATESLAKESNPDAE